MTAPPLRGTFSVPVIVNFRPWRAKTPRAAATTDEYTGSMGDNLRDHRIRPRHRSMELVVGHRRDVARRRRTKRVEPAADRRIRLEGAGTCLG